MKKITIACFSDNHGEIVENIPDADIVMCCGDVTYDGTGWSLDKFIDWFSKLPHKEKIFIAGNHDFCLNNDICKAMIPKNVIYLQDSLYKSKTGLKIYGSPYTPKFFHWSFMKQRGDEISEVWAKIPKGIDVLVTHGPASGILDRNQNGQQCGCYDLGRYINKIKPKVHLFGHIHHSRGITKIEQTLYVNCSILNDDYDYIYEPYLIEVEK
jgi:Icc-related predicted phosphoesterase